MTAKQRRSIQRIPAYLTGWFLAIITISAFTPISLGAIIRSLLVVAICYLIFNFKGLTNA